MKKRKSVLKSIICDHDPKHSIFIKNIYGDEIDQFYGCRSIWYCNKCNTIYYSSELYDVGNYSDGYHTFNELYHHRAILFATLCAAYEHLAWKSKVHSDGSMYDDMFIVGIDTPNGQATYHYNLDLWDIFKVKELDSAPEWDGHSSNDAIERIQSLIDTATYDGIINYITNANQSTIIHGNPKCKYCRKNKKKFFK